MTSLPETRVCATHPDEPALATCERCGDFYCKACASGADSVRCVRCGAKEDLAWEAWTDPLESPAALAKTARAILRFESGAIGAIVTDKPVARAIPFLALVVIAVVFVTVMVDCVQIEVSLGRFGMQDMSESVLLLLIGLPALIGALVLTIGEVLLLAVGLSAFGKAFTFRSALRVGAYASLFQVIPLLGSLLWLFFVFSCIRSRAGSRWSATLFATVPILPLSVGSS